MHATVLDDGQSRTDLPVNSRLRFGFSVIHGKDENDPTSYDASFDVKPDFDPTGLRIGYTKNKKLDAPEYQILKRLGCEFVQVELPNNMMSQALASIIDIEAAAGFDHLLREGHNEGWNRWTEIFQSANFISAVDYVRMMRLRSSLMQKMQELLKNVDFLFNVFDVFHTNLTGQPSIVLPRKISEIKEHQFSPRTVVITGRLNDDARLLQLASKYQDLVGPLSQRPALEHWLAKFDSGELDKNPKKTAGDQ